MKKIYIYVVCATVMLMASCVDSLDDYNLDQKRATVVPAATLFTGAVKNMTDLLTSPSVNTNNFRFYVQHWTTTQYLDEPRYNMTSRLFPQATWQGLYRDVLLDLSESKRLVNEDQITAPNVRNNQLAQIEIIEVYAWSVLLNTFGDVPYSQALNPENSLPAYDDAQTVYADILARLDASFQLIDPTASGFTTGDVLYNGQMSQWLKFGNSLKLKLAMITADVDQAGARTMVESAAAQLFTGNEDNTAFPYLNAPPNNNPVSSNVKGPLNAREDYVMANTLVNAMNALEDPRRQHFFSQVNGQFVGGRYGFPNDFASTSTVSQKVADPALEGLLLDYSEVEFLLAEAVERGFNVGGTAAEHYNNAITASITYWGGTAVEATAYLAQPGVNYTTASGDWKQKIGAQKWIALYNRGFDAWVEWRRLDAPALSPPVIEGAGALTIPKRLIYPINEQTLNGANRIAAGEAIGGDVAETKLWWDVN
jgi:hypothetical protein